MLEPVEILSQIPASFYTQMESKKWSDRKEALEIVEKATAAPKLQNTDYSELVRVLKKTVAKDSNIVVVTSAAKCLCQLAQGLGPDFGPYSSSCLTVLFEKFKEKKPNVISVIRDATDAAFVGTNIECIYEDVISFLDNKNPQIKSEVALFLARTFSHFSQQVMNKKTLRPMINALIKTLSDMDATVRDSSAMAIGTAMKITGEKLMMTLIADVEPIKITKIKECCERAEIVTAPVNGQGHDLITNGLATVDQQNNNQENLTNGVEDGEDDEERLFEMLEPVEILSQIPASFYTQMESKKWSDRKEALEIVEKATAAPKLQNTDYSELVRVLKKTVAKDSNIVVVTSAAKCLCQLAQGLRTNFAPYSSCMTVLFEKFKEKKPNVISVIRDATDAAFIGTNLENLFEEIIQFLDNKNPQIKSELALFLSRTFSKFPAQVLNKKTLRPLINALIKTLSDMDATVRDNSAMAIGTAMKITGEKLMMTLIADVEPIKIPKIKEFCEKAQVKKVPQSVLNTMNSAAPPQQVNNMPPPSSATMVRPKSTYNNNKLAKHAPPVVKSGLAKPAPASTVSGSSATVKRTATIIKRSTVPKRLSGQHQPPPPPTAVAQPPQATQVQAQVTPAPVFAQPAPHNFASPAPPLQHQRLNQEPIILTPAKPVFDTVQQQSNHRHDSNNLDMVVYRIISNNEIEIINSLTEIEEALLNNSENVLQGHINQIIDLVCLQLIKSVDGQKLNIASNMQSLKVRKIIECLTKLFAKRELVAAASQQSIRFLLVQIFTLTQICGNMNQDDDFTIKSLNNLASAIIDGFEPTNMMCILTGLLNDPPPSSIVESIKTAIIRSMRSFK